jgi:hypothetical protein
MGWGERKKGMRLALGLQTDWHHQDCIPMEVTMLEESIQQKEARQEQNHDESKVVCFVCKREVERDQAKRILYSKKKPVWVCAAHIK